MIEKSFKKLEHLLNELGDNNPLKPPISELLNHINVLNHRWSSSQQRIISFSFFDTLSEKILGKEKLVSPLELKEIIDKTLLLLDQQITIKDYNKLASNLQGHSSNQMKFIGTMMLAVAMICALGAVLAVAPAGIAIVTSISITSLLLGSLFYTKSGPSGLSKEANDIAIAYESSSFGNY